MDAVKIMARDLVRTRANVKKLYLMRANIQGVQMKLTTIKSSTTMAQSMKGVTKAMQRMNKKVAHVKIGLKRVNTMEMILKISEISKCNVNNYMIWMDVIHIMMWNID